MGCQVIPIVNSTEGTSAIGEDIWFEYHAGGIVNPLGSPVHHVVYVAVWVVAKVDAGHSARCVFTFSHFLVYVGKAETKERCSQETLVDG